MLNSKFQNGISNDLNILAPIGASILAEILRIAGLAPKIQHSK
jgi:hypothetical protein